MNKKLPFIKVCGQTHVGTVDTSLALGARYIGFIFHPSSPRSIIPERAAAIHTRFTRRVGVFVRQGAEDILRIMQIARLDYAQLHGAQTTEDAEKIGPDRVIRTIWPERCGTLSALQQTLDEWAPFCAMYLLDAGAHVGSGGTGKSLDVERFAHVNFPHPWILAGGVSARNIPQLLAHCSPDGIDLNSGVELAPGLKDPVKLLAAVHACRTAVRKS